jgi:hypothetical protein
MFADETNSIEFFGIIIPLTNFSFPQVPRVEFLAQQQRSNKHLAWSQQSAKH